MLIDLSRDELRSDGTWAMYRKINGKTVYTKAGSLYNGIKTRCDQNGYTVKVKPAYTGCTNGFIDFQDFASWATTQVGYGLQDYQLDKDLLSKGIKIYSKETCCFLPAKINSGLVNRKAVRSEHGLGVKLIKGKYRAFLNVDSEKVYLGTFISKEDAFNAYKVAKEANLKNIAERHKNIIDIRAYDALVAYVVVND